MPQVLISFTANQSHLSKAPKKVVETSKMCIWSMKVKRGEHIKCKPHQKLFTTRALNAGKVRVWDAASNSADLILQKSQRVELDVPAGFSEIVSLENISDHDLDFLTVEYQYH